MPKPPVVIHFTPVYTFYPKSPQQGRAIYDDMLKRCTGGTDSLTAQCSGYLGPCSGDVGCQMQQSLLYGEACSHFQGVCSKKASWNSFVDALGAAGGAFGFEGHGPEGEKAESGIFKVGARSRKTAFLRRRFLTLREMTGCLCRLGPKVMPYIKLKPNGNAVFKAILEAR